MAALPVSSLGLRMPDDSICIAISLHLPSVPNITLLCVATMLINQAFTGGDAHPHRQDY